MGIMFFLLLHPWCASSFFFIRPPLHVVTPQKKTGVPPTRSNMFEKRTSARVESDIWKEGLFVACGGSTLHKLKRCEEEIFSPCFLLDGEKHQKSALLVPICPALLPRHDGEVSAKPQNTPKYCPYFSSRRRKGTTKTFLRECC